MKKMISFPKIHDFKSVIKDVTHVTRFIGTDLDGNVMYNNNPLPTLNFIGTVKLHGTNSGISYNKEEGIWYQSRKNIITPQNDNAGFAFYVDTHKEAFIKIINQVSIDNNVDLDKFTITIFGEWAGKGIQKGMGITQLDKAFYLFGVKISKSEDPEFVNYWVNSTKYSDEENRIYNVDHFKTFSIDIDFNNPNVVVDRLTDITNDVEKECPIAKQFGVSGIGEGVVWRTEYKGSVLRFKVKGEKHKVVKSEKIVNIDSVKMNSISEFVDYTVTENRIDQAIESVFGDKEVEKTKLGDLIRWVYNDIISEESDVLSENNLEPKDVSSAIANKVGKMFLEICNKI